MSLSFNREHRRASKPGKFWCYSCDGVLVSEYGKCPNCGARNGDRARKTPKLEIAIPMNVSSDDNLEE